MKTTGSTTAMKPVKNRPSFWVFILINQLGFPGLGTIMARRPGGYPQAVIMVAGFLLVMGYFLWLFVCMARYVSGAYGTQEEFTRQYQHYAWSWKSGLALCLVAWVWALFSSIQIWRHGQSGLPKTHVGPPPIPS